MKQRMITAIENFIDGIPSFGLAHSYKNCRIESHLNKINNSAFAFQNSMVELYWSKALCMPIFLHKSWYYSVIQMVNGEGQLWIMRRVWIR